MTNLLLIEDNPKHLADAKALLEDRVKIGAISGVDYATNLTEAEELLRTRKYDGIISDVFFPKEAGGIEQQLGTTIGQYALDHEIPFVLVTSTHHHGYKTEPVHRWALDRSIKMFDAENILSRGSREGEADRKQWEWGYTFSMYLIECIKQEKISFKKDKSYITGKELPLGIRTNPGFFEMGDVLMNMNNRYLNVIYPSCEIFHTVIDKYCSGMFDGMIKK